MNSKPTVETDSAPYGSYGALVYANLDKCRSKNLSNFELAQLLSAMFGLMYSYSLLVSYVTPLFMESHGVSIKNVGFIHIATPITSLIAQLCVGTWSDRLGKRLSFFRCGIIAVVIGLVSLPFSTKLSKGPLSLVAALLAVWVSGFGLNSALVILRAAVADMVPKAQQVQANGMFASAAGLGLLSNHFLASMDLTWAKDALGLTHTELLFVVGSCMCLLSSLLTETLLRKGDQQIQSTLRLHDAPTLSTFLGEMRQLWAFWRLPPWLAPACAALFWTWVGWFALIMFTPAWTSSDIFGGGAAAQSGLRWASLCMSLQAAVCAVLGLGFFERFMRELGPLKSLVVTLWAQALLQLGLLGPEFLSQSRPALAKSLQLILFGMMGASWGLIHSIPYVIIGENGDSQKNGKLIGRVNTFVVIAQLIVAFAVRPLSCIFTQKQAINVIILGGCCNLLGLIQMTAVGDPLLIAKTQDKTLADESQPFGK